MKIGNDGNIRSVQASFLGSALNANSYRLMEPIGPGLNLDIPPNAPGGGGGDSDMKWTGMLVVSLRGVNFGFWSRLGCSGQNVIIFSRQGLV